MWRGKLSSGASVLWDEMLATDLAERVTELTLPAYFFHGIYDYTVSYPLAKDYFERLKAPLKGFYSFDRSAHSPILEEPEKARRIMRRTCWQERIVSLTVLASKPFSSSDLAGSAARICRMAQTTMGGHWDVRSRLGEIHVPTMSSRPQSCGGRQHRPRSDRPNRWWLHGPADVPDDRIAACAAGSPWPPPPVIYAPWAGQHRRACRSDNASSRNHVSSALSPLWRARCPAT